MCALLDLAGVVYEGERLLPGAKRAIDRLNDAGIAVRFVSNTTRLARKQIIARLNNMGVSVNAEMIFTPAIAARQWVKDRDLTAELLVHPSLLEDLVGLQGTKGTAVIVGDAGDTFTYANLNRAFQTIQSGAELLALARNRTFRDQNGELSLDAGPFVVALEYASRTESVVVGKPTAAFFLAACDSAGCAPGDAAMVGDDAESDIAGALAAGIGRAFLVRTGKYTAGDETAFFPEPSAVVSDIAAAVDLMLS